MAIDIHRKISNSEHWIVIFSFLKILTSVVDKEMAYNILNSIP